MKKHSYILSLLLLTSILAHAQTFDEWFHQNKTELRYMHEQLIALQATIDATEDGNSMEEDGLDLISEEEDADKTQHSIHFTSLLTLTPSITNHPSITTIANLTPNLIQIAAQLNDLAAGLPTYGDYLHSSASQITTSLDAWSSQLNNLLTDNQLSMQDAERTARLRRIASQMNEAYSTAIHLYWSCLIIKSAQ